MDMESLDNSHHHFKVVPLKRKLLINGLVHITTKVMLIYLELI